MHIFKKQFTDRFRLLACKHHGAIFAVERKFETTSIAGNQKKMVLYTDALRHSCCTILNYILYNACNTSQVPRRELAVRKQATLSLPRTNHKSRVQENLPHSQYSLMTFHRTRVLREQHFVSREHNSLCDKQAAARTPCDAYLPRVTKG